ncbi:MAG: ATP-binding protein, partial [Thermotogota bacterium]
KTLLKEWAMKLDEVGMESLKSGQTLVKVMNWEEKVYKIMMAPLRSQDDSVTGVVEYALDITELEEAKVKAQEASRAKSEFLAHMSHEIRTPLNAVIGFSDLLKNTPLNTSQKKYLNNINTSATLLMDLINDILDFSKIESGKLQLNPEPANIIEIMQNTLQFVKPAIRNKPVKLSFTQEGTIPERIEIDVVRIRQIITNLLSNAVKFTQKGEIELKVAAKSQNKNGQTTLSFTVRDTGIGISKENQKKIFEAFAQADPSTTKRFGGTGLGLTITNKLLKMMNSKLALLSEPGKGSDFSFTLSLPEVSGETTTEPPEMEKVTLKKKSEIFSQPITIMISEDNILNIEMTEVFLSTLLENATIVKASNGLEAIKQYRKNKPDMIFMDIQMPQMNGYEATKNIRKLAEENNDKPLIIAFSATSLSEEKKKAFEAGMDDYMTKPVSEKNFEQILLKHASHLSASKSESTQAADQLHHFNREQFERKMGNDQEAIQHIIQIGRKALDNGEIHLTAAFESKDPTTIQKAAHQLKGMAANMHFDILQSLTVEMETLAEQGESLPKLEILLKEIKNEIALLREIKKPPE